MVNNNAAVSESISSGSRVIISDIVSRPEINCEIGTICSFDSKTSRYIVELESSLEKLRIRPKNVTYLPTTKSIDLEGLEGILRDIDGPRSGRDILSSEVESRERWPFYPKGVSTKNVDLACGWHAFESRITNGANGCAMVMAKPHKSVTDLEFARLKAGHIGKKLQPIRWLFPEERGKIDLTDKRRVVDVIAQFCDDEKHRAPWPLSDYTWHCPGCLRECLDGIFSLEGMVWMVPPIDRITLAARFLPRLWCGTCYDEIRLAVRDKDTGEDCKYLIDRARYGSPYDEEGTDILNLWERYSWLKMEYMDLIGETLEENVVGKHSGRGNWEENDAVSSKNEDKDDSLDRFDEEQIEARLAELNRKAESAGLFPIQKRAKNEAPKPSCEVCGEIPAELTCGSCTVTSYCSKSCQKVDWRERGHRETCKTLRAKLKRDVACVLKALRLPKEAMDDTDPEVSYARVGWAAANLLDNGAAYSLACKDGLHDALRSFFTEDTHKMEARYTNKIPCSWTSMAVNSLFKKRSLNPSRSTSRADGEKCANYVSSHNEAWPAWLGASVKMAHCVFLPAVRYDAELATLAQRAGRDAWAFLQLALIQRDCAYAILVECGHGKGTAATLREALAWIEGKWQGDDSPDPNGTITGIIAAVIGMVHVWHDRFVKENILEEESFRTILASPGVSAVKLNGHLEYLLAEATIHKGKFLDNTEASAIARACRDGLGGMGKASNNKTGKKKKKNKNRKKT